MPRPNIVLEPEKHIYHVNGEEYPSVTKIISATVPKDLSWWGMEVGVAGVCILSQRKKLLYPLRPDQIKALLTAEKLTTNHIFRGRGESGIAIHKALEDYGRTGKIPSLDDFPEYDHQRIAYLCQWLLDNRPEFLEQEVQTASLQYRYAGTFDARILFHAGEYKGKTCLVDLKTSKYVYPESHYPQLEAYEFAELEAGYPHSDYRLVLHLSDNVPASLHGSIDCFDDFRVLLDHYQTIILRRERIKSAKKAAKEAAKEAKMSGVQVAS